MPIYVDHARNKFGRMLMCHMLADTDEELHAFAKRIGMRREWFQNQGRYPHYDISQTKRVLAVKLGAIEISDRQVVELMRGKRPEIEPLPTQMDLLSYA